MIDFCFMVRVPDIQAPDSINKVIPFGYETIPATEARPWPKDAHGATYVPLRCLDRQSSSVHWILKARELERELVSLRPRVE